MNETLEPRISIEDLKDKARRIGDLATAEVRHVTRERTTQTIVAGVALVAAAVAVAYYLGSRRCYREL